MRTTLIAVAIAALALSGCTATVSGKTHEAIPPTSTTSPSPSATGAKAKYGGTCDTDLGSGTGSDYSLTSEIEIRNTGNVDVKAAVLVSWPQYGHAPIGTGKVITLKAGKSRTLELNKHVSMAQFGRAQDYQLKHGGELKCRYKVMINPVP